MKADNAELVRQFTARRDRMLARASPWPILWIALGMLLFIGWDLWLDAANAAVGRRFVVAAALLPLFAAIRWRWVKAAGARWVYGGVFLLGIWGISWCVLPLRGGFEFGMASLIMIPLSLAFYPLPPRWYLALNVVALAGVGVLLQGSSAAPEQTLNFCIMYALAATVGLVAMRVQMRQQWRLFQIEQRHAQDARTDALTGLMNRRFLELWGSRHVAAAVRLQRPFSIALFDLDHFKRINDQHGHEAGDEALREAAGLLVDALRAVDQVGRWGGEEFLALLVDTDGGQALAAAERCLQRIAQAPLALRSGVAITLGCSAGVAALQPGEDFEALVRRADAALYCSKDRGRGRATLAAAAP
jgi:diguanylate cyclase (GGDEF)-like protein